MRSVVVLPRRSVEQARDLAVARNEADVVHGADLGAAGGKRLAQAAHFDHGVFLQGSQPYAPARAARGDELLETAGVEALGVHRGDEPAHQPGANRDHHVVAVAADYQVRPFGRWRSTSSP